MVIDLHCKWFPPTIASRFSLNHFCFLPEKDVSHDGHFSWLWFISYDVCSAGRAFVKVEPQFPINKEHTFHVTNLQDLTTKTLGPFVLHRAVYWTCKCVKVSLCMALVFLHSQNHKSLNIYNNDLLLQHYIQAVNCYSYILLKTWYLHSL